MGNIPYKSIFEAIVLSVVFVIASYIWNHEDPLFIKEGIKILPYLFVLALIALYYGLMAGIASLVVFAISLYKFYPSFPYEIFFWHALLTFMFGEFNYYWKRKIYKHETENTFLKEKIENLGRNFFMLKISHDQLEKNYVLKPLSIRSILKEIRELILKKEDDNELFKNFLMLISRFTNIESASLYIKEGDKFKEVASIGSGATLIKDDPLIQKALTEKTSVYVSVNAIDDKSQTKYMAVLPVVDIFENVSGLLVISQMPFLSLNKDNLLSISVFLTYLFDEIFITREIDKLVKEAPELPSHFIKELDRIIDLKRKFSIESTLVVFYMDKENFSEAVFVEIERRLRGLDISTRFSQENKEKLVVLLPFTSDVSAAEFLKRIKNDINEFLGEEFGKNLKHHILPLEKASTIQVLRKIKEV